MKINLKVRLRNKTFVAASVVLIISFLYTLLSLFGFVPQVSEKQITELAMMGINILAFLGVLIDPTTKGINDSERAMQYLRVVGNDIESEEVIINE